MNSFYMAGYQAGLAGLKLSDNRYYGQFGFYHWQNGWYAGKREVKATFENKITLAISD